MRKLLIGICAFFALASTVQAQKKELDTTAYKQWHRLSSPIISHTGEWFLYGYFMEENNDRYLVHPKSGKEIMLEDVTNAEFFGGGNWLKYTVNRNNKDSVLLRQLSSGKTLRWEGNVFFKTSPVSERIVFTEFKPDGSRIVVRDLSKGDSVVLNGIGRHFIFDDESSIVYIKNKELRSGALKGSHALLFEGDIADMSFDETLKQGSFVSGEKLYVFSLKNKKVREWMDFSVIRAPEGFKFEKKAYPVTTATQVLLLELAPAVTPQRKMQKPLDPGFELELWTWNEPVLQTKQRRGVYDKNYQNYPKVIYTAATRTCKEIAPDGSERLIAPAADAFNFVFRTDQEPYRLRTDWTYDPASDVYLIDVRTGESKLVVKDAGNLPVWTPGGKFAIRYNEVEQQWQVLDTVSRSFKTISSGIGFPVHDEDHDFPRPAPAYGMAGWADQGNSIVVYDRYDLWVIDLSGKKAPYSLTKGYGRKHQVRLRLQGAEFQEKLDISKRLLFNSFNEKTKSKGVYAFEPGKGVEKLLDEPAYSSRIDVVSGDGTTCVFTKESYTMPRDIWWADTKFRSPKKITAINAQQQQYNWGTVRLIEWKNLEGKPNKGLLYLPENYDSTRSYPTIVDFYQTHSEELHEYLFPELSTATINIPTYVSKGYIVFRPDVHFTIGAPGESAVNAVISGTQTLIERGIADKKRIGLQGHSWSGYQTLYLITRSNLFACANAGAAVSNMSYNYFAIRNSGAPCMFLYETGQSRMGKNLWEDQQGYIDNSPIYRADKVQTPLLLFHCDKDGAVAYTQGQSFFLAMRRLGKPAWLLNYKGENHTLNGIPAQHDWTIRLEQFFEHYLNEKPMPRWMKEGISIDERKFDLKY
ncbi:MAG: prolyl oligopeptidase family serine peptidase [Chitinophagaceae bacterium]